MIVDTHAHLADETLSAELDYFLSLAKAADVRAILTIGTTRENSLECIKLAEKYSQVRAAVGLHPNNCCQAASGDWQAIVEMAKHPQVAALGETGLDRYWDDCPWEVQVDYFRRHLALSRETLLPVVIHTRECAEETLELLRKEADGGQLRGVMHSFTGPQAVAEGCLELGLYLSFAGMLTFKNAAEIREIAKVVPANRLLVETDSPYLTPHPYRGKRPNHPANTAYTLAALAELRSVSVAELAQVTSENAFRLFGAWQVDPS